MISAAGQAVDPVTPRRVGEFLQNGGYMGKVEKAESACRVCSTSEGKNFNVYFHPPSGDDTAAATNIQIVSTFRLGKDEFDPILRICNTFNREFRFAKASVSDDAIYFQMDLGCVDGASIVSLGKFFVTYRQLLSQFLAKVQTPS